MNKQDTLRRYVAEQVTKTLLEMTNSTPAVKGGLTDPANIDGTPDERLGHLDPAKVDEMVGSTAAHDGGMIDPGKVSEDPEDRLGHLDPAKLTELRAAIRKLAERVIREMTNATPAHDGGMVDPGNVEPSGDKRLGQTDPGKLVEDEEVDTPAEIGVEKAPHHRWA